MGEFFFSIRCRWAEPGCLLSGMLHSAGSQVDDMQLGFVAGGTFWGGSGVRVQVWPGRYPVTSLWHYTVGAESNF